jgi:hypothetical protein
MTRLLPLGSYARCMRRLVAARSAGAFTWARMGPAMRVGVRKDHHVSPLISERPTGRPKAALVATYRRAPHLRRGIHATPVSTNL